MVGIRRWALACLGMLAACEVADDGVQLAAAELTQADVSARSWQQAPLMPAYTAPELAVVHSTLTLFGSSDELERSGTLDTWQWNAGAWHRKQPVSAPSDRLLPGAARYSDKILMFGGFTNGDYFSDGYSTESWHWDGCKWLQLTLPTTPPARNQPGISTLGASVIMFGGQDANGTRNDTWIYTWRDWVEQPMAAGPSHCTSPIAVLGTTALMFCGATEPSDRAGHTWLWDGTHWNEKQTLTRPSSRYAHVLASFKDRIVMFGGYAESGNWQETWEWDGNDWHDRTLQPSPPPRTGYQLMQDRGELVLFGGGESATWAWNGERWRIAQPPTMPAQRRDYSIGTLGERAILFGGCCKSAGGGQPQYWDDTWAWNGHSWSELKPARRPPPRAASSLVQRNGELLMFGGIAREGLLDDTWVFDGNSWAERTPNTHPQARQHHAMAAYGGEVFVFGGAGKRALRSDAALGDMWAWDGSSWRQVPVAAGPAPSYQSAMTAFGDKLALFEAASSRLWLWDGRSWSIGSDDWGISPLSSTPIYLLELPLGAAGSHLVVAGTSFMQFASREWDGSSWSSPSFLQLDNLGPIATQGNTLVSLAGWPLRTWIYGAH